jgi:regulator of PEP synthase PpsR (kinase-PPPase family)
MLITLRGNNKKGKTLFCYMFINRLMNEKYNVYLVSDSTGETLDRIFLSLKSQFSNFEYEKKEFAFVRTEQQIDKIIKECNQIQNCLILYTIVETKLAKYISIKSEENKVPCFGILGNLILSFSKLLNQKAIHKPSAQHVLDEDYYKRIEAIQFTMSHDDGKKVDDINNADVVLLGVSRTSKTPTSIYLANRGYKTVNVPLVLDQKIPDGLEINKKSCIVGLVADPERLADIRRNRVAIMKDHTIKEYTDLKFIKDEVESSKKLFKKNNWPIIDVTRRSVEETAASILKIIEIKKNR